jgi:hypothetical protein
MYLKAPIADIQENAYFGIALSISKDTIVIGAKGMDIDGIEDSGKAYVYVRDGNTWAFEAPLVAESPMKNAYFGSSVSIS